MRQWGDAALADLCSQDCRAWRDGASLLGEEISASSVSDVLVGGSVNEKHWNSHFLFSLLLAYTGPLIFASVLAEWCTKERHSLGKTLKWKLSLVPVLACSLDLMVDWLVLVTLTSLSAFFVLFCQSQLICVYKYDQHNNTGPLLTDNNPTASWLWIHVVLHIPALD